MVETQIKQPSSMSPVSPCFVSHDYLMFDVFPNIPGITSKLMCGGFSFYKNGVIFACIANDTLYFKVDDINPPQYEALGCQPFVYEHKNTKKITAMPYAELPESVLEDPEQLKLWIDASVAASLRSQKKKNKTGCLFFT
jgi:DNA transformation protein